MKVVRDYDAEKKATKQDGRKIGMMVVIVLLLCSAVVYMFFGGGMAQAAKPAASVPGLTATATKFAESSMSFANFGNATSVLAVARVPAGATPPALSLGVRCYATIDAKSIYSDTEVFLGGLFYAEKYTRVFGGRVFNSRLGWYDASVFGCQGDLGSVEVEYIVPKSTATKPVATRQVLRATATLVVVPTPVDTVRPAGVSFAKLAGDSCGVVSYAVGVKAVYLSYGGKRLGIAGDDRGAPVVTSVCPYSGTVSLDVYFGDGSMQHRSVEVVSQ